MRALRFANGCGRSEGSRTRVAFARRREYRVRGGLLEDVRNWRLVTGSTSVHSTASLPRPACGRAKVSHLAIDPDEQHRISA